MHIRIICMYVNSFIEKGPHACAGNGSNGRIYLLVTYTVDFGIKSYIVDKHFIYKFVQNDFHSLLWQVASDTKLQIEGTSWLDGDAEVEWWGVTLDRYLARALITHVSWLNRTTTKLGSSFLNQIYAFNVIYLHFWICKKEKEKQSLNM